MLSTQMIKKAEEVLERCRASGLMIATAESCTGGLVAAALTSIAGSSDVIERGFVTYSNEAKSELLNVPPALIQSQGAVSEPVARAMAQGALERSRAQLSVSITGIAGPGGGSPEKPVGLVYLAVSLLDRSTHAVKMTYGDIGRDGIREAAVGTALGLLHQRIIDEAG